MTTYIGQAANVTIPASVPIASSTDATPIIVTTSGVHNLLDGQQVDVQGHATNVAANGVRRIGYVSTTQFSLIGSVGSGAGAGGATGTVQSIAPPAYTLVDGSVPPTAGAFNGPTEFNADTSALLWQATGAWKTVYENEIDHTDDTLSAWDYFTLTSDGTWTLANSGLPIFYFTNLYNIDQGDRVKIDFDFNAAFGATTGNSSVIRFALFASVAQPGAAFSSAFRVAGSMAAPDASYSSNTNAATFFFPMRLSGTLVAGAGSWPTGNSYAVKFFVLANSLSHATLLNLSPGNCNLFGDYMSRVTVKRPTGLPQ